MCVPNFVEIGAQEHKLCVTLCLVQRNEENLPSFRDSYLRNGWVVCKVLYIKALKYVELVEKGAIVFEL